MTNQEIIEKHGLSLARIMAYSKTRYCESFPDNKPVFNANIFTKSDDRKIWFGDLDLVADEEKLKKIGEEIGEFIVVREMDGRFDNEYIDYKKAKGKAVYIFKK
jgi:hypothetical protein